MIALRADPAADPLDEEVVDRGSVDRLPCPNERADHPNRRLARIEPARPFELGESRPPSSSCRLRQGELEVRVPEAIVTREGSPKGEAHPLDVV